MSNLQSSEVNRTSTFLFYDVTTTPELFAEFRDEAVMSNQCFKWVSEEANATCAATMSAMDEMASRRTAPVKVSMFLTSTNAGLVELGTEKIRQVNTFGHAMRMLVKKYQRLEFLFRAVLGVEMNGFVFVKGGMYLQSALEGMRTVFVHSFDMAVPTAFEVVMYLTELVHTDAIINGKKLNTHRTYKAGNRVAVAVSLVSAKWKQILRKSGTGTSIKDLKPYMLFNQHTRMYEILPDCDDGYAPTDQLEDLECAAQSVHTQPGIEVAAWGRTGLQDLGMRYLAYKMFVCVRLWSTHCRSAVGCRGEQLKRGSRRRAQVFVPRFSSFRPGIANGGDEGALAPRTLTG